MSTRTKFIIAGAIVAALVGLIVIDVTSGSGKKKDSNGTPKLAGKTRTSTPAPRQPEPPALEPTSIQDTTPVTIVVPTTTPTSPSAGTTPTPGPGPVQPGPRPIQDPPTTAPLATAYEVKSGDSFWKISQQVYGDGNLWKQIADANPTVDSHALRPGMKLQVPAKRETARRTTASRETSAIVVNGNGKAYTVKSGDVLWNIAKANARGRNVMDALHRIQEANPSLDPERLQIGMQIVIPD